MTENINRIHPPESLLYEWLTDWMTDWMTDWLNEWLNEWLISVNLRHHHNIVKFRRNFTLKMTENYKFRKAILSAFYSISKRNFGILLILWCAFKLWWRFCLDLLSSKFWLIWDWSIWWGRLILGSNDW
jgi:hypothetical protein